MKGKASSQTMPLIKETDTGHIEFIYGDIKKASLSNAYFTSISSFDDVPDSLPDFESRTLDVFDSIDISRKDVIDAINTLEIDKACGIDGISNILIKAISEYIFKPLTLLLNLSLSNSCFPRCWKEANVIPLFKKEDAKSPSNYRPLSSLSCIGKLMERMTFKYMNNFIHEHNLIYK